MCRSSDTEQPNGGPQRWQSIGKKDRHSETSTQKHGREARLRHRKAMAMKHARKPAAADAANGRSVIHNHQRKSQLQQGEQDLTNE